MIQLSLLKRDWIQENEPIVLKLFAGKEFTADDLHGALPEPEEKNWFGCLCAALKNSGKIIRIGYRPSVRPERNGGVIAVWKTI